jgi:hypothetical protein
MTLSFSYLVTVKFSSISVHKNKNLFISIHFIIAKSHSIQRCGFLTFGCLVFPSVGGWGQKSIYRQDLAKVVSAEYILQAFQEHGLSTL